MGSGMNLIQTDRSYLWSQYLYKSFFILFFIQTRISCSAMRRFSWLESGPFPPNIATHALGSMMSFVFFQWAFKFNEGPLRLYLVAE